MNYLVTLTVYKNGKKIEFLGRVFSEYENTEDTILWECIKQTSQCKSMPTHKILEGVDFVYWQEELTDEDNAKFFDEKEPDEDCWILKRF